MKELEGKTKECYLEDFENINSHDFVKMMTLDSCFIVELLQSYLGKDMEKPIFETRWMLPTIAHDLLMLENQLPKFVPQKIFELTTIKREPTLNMLALQFFVPLRPGKDKLKIDILETKGKYPHLLALFHSTFVHNATSLKHVGVRFRKKSGNLLGMEFKSGKLKIPPLFINDSTGPLLRNLIAYEQSDRYPAPCFSCLVIILDSLVDTIEDIDILRDAGIIKQVKGGNEEVVNLLNSLSKHLEFDIDDYCITEKIVAVNHFYRSKWFRVLFILVHSKIGYLGWMILYVAIIQFICYHCPNCR
ncbi:UPF0481 protein At3g47200-like [Quercus suber]|uniref:UPF0481 protein At3g47200-like n=1 Tax=Quercus suber TaxID=58331 RepID=UPI0032DFA5E4